jgi:hypothetical protein
MSDLERRLRAAMMAASEQAPANLIPEIRRRHRRRVRRVSVMCAAVAASIAIAVPPVANALRAGNPPVGRSGGPAATSPAAPSASPAGSSAGDCPASVGALASNWRASSLRAAPVWFAYARSQGYVRLGGSPGDHRGSGRLEVGVMIIEVDYGSRAILTVDPGAQSYFRFLNGFNNSSGSDPISAGLTSLTLVGCPAGTPPGDNGSVSDYYLGFIIERGSDALVSVRASPSARPIPLVFTCVRAGCNT